MIIPNNIDIKIEQFCQIAYRLSNRMQCAAVITVSASIIVPPQMNSPSKKTWKHGQKFKFLNL